MWLVEHPYTPLAVAALVFLGLAALGGPRWMRLHGPHDYVAPDCGERCCRECQVCGREHLRSLSEWHRDEHST